MGRHRSGSASPRGDEASKWDGASGYRVHVADLATGTSRREVERAFSKYGSINEVWVATNPPCFAFVNFSHRSDAEKAIRDVNGKVIGSTRVGVSWARDRTYASRYRGGRGAPFGSYRSHRRSRSRSPRDSYRQKRRYSRSRSRDRDRRRSRSPSDRKRSSRRRSEEKSGNDRRKSRSRSASPPRKASPSPSKKRSPSPGAEKNHSPVENNTHERSASPVDDN